MKKINEFLEEKKKTENNKLKKEVIKILENEIKNFTKEEEKEDYFYDLTSRGADDGMITSLLFYDEIIKFYNDNTKEIFEHLHEEMFDKGYKNLYDMIIGLEITESLNTVYNKQYLVWFAVDGIAFNLFDEYKSQQFLKKRRINALKKFLEYENREEVSKNKIIQTYYDEHTFDYFNNYYMVLTDEEADEKTKEHINKNLWTFNSDFIINHSSILDHDKPSRQIIEVIQKQYENGNESIKKLIDNIDEFVESAIKHNGRGYFLSGYDGEERTVNNFFIYIVG